MQEDTTAIRRHVRLVTGIPIEITLDYRHTHYAAEDAVTNISAGGLCFVASDRLDPGETAQVRIPILARDNQIDGRVVWCNKTARGYEVGLEFDDPERVEHMQLIEYISQIESYRREAEQNDGLQLSTEQAAREWIRRYAGEFSALN
ncbi:MAG: PilZ domain-containing protein [Gammaproteobacteria bacterium]|nr:PilZ domain-containing protein [Gammaproteobacteria bacterium]